MIKSINLCFNIASVWKFVIRNEISYPWRVSCHNMYGYTGIGFLLRMMKFSARPVKNLVNLCARIRSMSSACLILILIRIALIDDSTRTCSFSFRAICIGFKSISEEFLSSVQGHSGFGKGSTWPQLQGHCVVPRLGLRSSLDIMRQSDLPEYSSDRAARYSTIVN